MSVMSWPGWCEGQLGLKGGVTDGNCQRLLVCV